MQMALPREIKASKLSSALEAYRKLENRQMQLQALQNIYHKLWLHLEIIIIKKFPSVMTDRG